MIKKIATGLGALALVAVIGVFAATSAFAQSTTPPAAATPASPTTQAPGAGLRGGFDIPFGGGNWIASFDAEAKALNLTPTQLFEQLHGGKTLSDIATAQGVDVTKVQDAVKAVQTQAMKDNIAQAVKDGTMTQAQADWLLQGIENGYSNGGPGFGPIGGRGGHGMGGRALPGGTAPSAPTTPSTTAPSTQG